jgi:hypothetical protein
LGVAVAGCCARILIVHVSNTTTWTDGRPKWRASNVMNRARSTFLEMCVCVSCQCGRKGPLRGWLTLAVTGGAPCALRFDGFHQVPSERHSQSVMYRTRHSIDHHG